MGVAAEHLLVHVLDLVLEALRKAGCLAEPVVWIGLHFVQARERRGRREVVSREEGLVLDFARDPGLDVLDVGCGWEVDGVAARVDPGVGRAVGVCQ